MGEGNWRKVAARSDLADGDVLAIELGERKIALYDVGGELYATDNICTHAFALLSDGWLDGNEIECPLHAGRFDVRTGKALCLPVEQDVVTYAVRVAGEDIELLLPPG